MGSRLQLASHPLSDPCVQLVRIHDLLLGIRESQVPALPHRTNAQVSLTLTYVMSDHCFVTLQTFPPCCCLNTMKTNACYLPEVLYTFTQMPADLKACRLTLLT